MAIKIHVFLKNVSNLHYSTYFIYPLKNVCSNSCSKIAFYYSLPSAIVLDIA